MSAPIVHAQNDSWLNVTKAFSEEYGARRIDQANNHVYIVKGEEIIIPGAKGHYEK